MSLTVPISSITASDRDRMFNLMEMNYLGMERPTFETDLREKQHMMLLRDELSGEIVGFSTLMVLNLHAAGRIVQAVFSGDTIVQSKFRHTLGLGIELGNYLLRISRLHPGDVVVWLLTSKGCRTYGILPLLFREFYPRLDAPTPGFYTAIMDAFGARKYPMEYDPEVHVVRHTGTVQRLRPGVAPASEHRLRDPHVRFFIQANPGHEAGDDLVCVADACMNNWSPRFRRMVSA